MINGVFPAILVNKDVAVFSDSSPPAPKGTQEGEEHRDPAAIRPQPPPTLRNAACSVLAPES